MPVVEEQIKVINHRIEDLEKQHKWKKWSGRKNLDRFFFLVTNKVTKLVTKKTL
jgi:hypothetical protein